MKTRIEKSIDAKRKKFQSHLDLKLNQMMNLILSSAKTVKKKSRFDKIELYFSNIFDF